MTVCIIYKKADLRIRFSGFGAIPGYIAFELEVWKSIWFAMGSLQPIERFSEFENLEMFRELDFRDSGKRCDPGKGKFFDRSRVPGCDAIFSIQKSESFPHPMWKTRRFPSGDLGFYLWVNLWVILG